MADSANDRPKGSDLPDLKSVIVGELAQVGDWVVANLDTSISWPMQTQKVSYRGEEIWLIPLIHDHYAAVAMRASAERDVHACQRLLMRFLSALSWTETGSVSVSAFTGGRSPQPMRRDNLRGYTRIARLDLAYVPEPQEDRTLLALALMREGRALNHAAYAFLTFYRVLEAALPNGRTRGTWIDGALIAVAQGRVAEAIDKLKAAGIADIGKHIYESGRMAIAHAANSPVVDPDDPAESRRLRSELPIMIALAERAISECLGVQTSHEVWEEHLYELQGFKPRVGTEIIALLAQGETITPGTNIELPNIDIRIRQRPPYPALADMRFKDVWQVGQRLGLRYDSPRHLCEFFVELDFVNERLEFDIATDLHIKDDGTANGAEAVADLKEFSWHYFANGQLAIHDHGTGELLSRKDGYMPVNMFLNVEAALADVAEWRAKAEARRLAEQALGAAAPWSHNRYIVRMSTEYQSPT